MSTSTTSNDNQKAAATMLRNDLIIQLSQFDNDGVTVDVKGILIDVEAVTTDRGSVVLVLNPEDLRSTLDHVPDPTRSKKH